MIHWIWLIPAVMAGGAIGVLMMCLCYISSWSDRNDH